jgi:opacity protein-like surface antigen
LAIPAGRDYHTGVNVKTIIAAMFALLIATSSHGQDKGYVQGVGGLTFQSEISGLFGGEFGANVTRDVQIYGQVGRMINILPKSIQDDLDDAAQALTLLTGDRWQFDGKIPATYFGGGLKLLIPTGARVRPFVIAGVGAATMKASIKEIDLGEILDDLIDEGFIDEGDVRGTEFAFELGGGLSIPVGARMQIDGGYRLMRISRVNVSRFVGGVGVRF